jgi:methyl-accepting chemotaxis protein
MVEKVLTAVLDAQQTIASELVAVAEALEDVAEDAGVTSETMDSVSNAADSTRNAMGQVSATLATTQEEFDGVDISAREAAIGMDAASEAAENVRNSNAMAAASAENTAQAIDEESQSFREAFASAESLEDAKSAASRANQVLSETADATKRALNEEMGAMVKMAQSSSTGAELVNRLRNSNLALSGAVSKVDKDLSDMNAEMAANEVLMAAGAEEIDNVAVSQTKLAAATTTTTEELDQEATTFKEAFASAETLAEAKNAASIANSKLSATAKRTKEKINEETGAMFRMANSAATSEEFVESLRNSNLTLAQTVSFTEEQIEDLSAAQLADAAISQIHADSLDRVADEMEEVGDEAQQAALSIAGLGGAFSSTSLNIGPFNFALRRAAVQIPQLVITTGALATSLLGLASAAGIAGGALAGIFAGGLIAKADRVAASSSDIEGRLEAMEEIAGNVREMFIRALEPLIDGESVAIFEGTLESLAGAVNLLAQVADNLQDDLVAAGNEISNAFGDNATAILTEMEDTVEAFLPLIVDLIGYFADHLPNALQFFQQEGVTFTQTLGEFGKQIVGFFKTFTEVGIPILEGAITAIRGVLEAFEIVANVLNTLPDGVLETAFAYLFLSRIFDSVLAKGMAIGSFFVNLGGSIGGATGALGTFNSILGGLQLTGTQRALGRILDKFGLLEPVLLNSSGAAQTAMQQFDEFDLPDPEKSLDESILGDDQSVSDAYFSNIRQKFSGLRSSIGDRLSGIRTSIGNAFSRVPTPNTQPVRNAFSRLSDSVSGSLGFTRETVEFDLSEIGSTIRNKASVITGPIGSAFDSVKSSVASRTDDILGLVTSFIGDLKQRIAGTNIGGAVSEGLGGISEAVSSKFADLNRVETTSTTTIPAPEVRMEALETLDIGDADATEDRINSAYRDLVTEVHPDQGGSAEAFKEVDEAYTNLTDEEFEFTSRKEEQVEVTTRTQQARERLNDIGQTAVDTKNRITSAFSDRLSGVSEAFGSVTGKARQFAGKGLSAVSTGLQSLAARGVGVVSVATGVGEAFVSAVPGLGNFDRAIGNIKSGLQIISPELASLADGALDRIPTSFSEAGNVVGGFKSRVGDLIPTVGSVTESLPALTSASDDVAGALPAASEAAQDTASNLPVLSSAVDDATDADVGFFSNLKNRLLGLTDVSFGGFGIRDRLSRITDVSIGEFGIQERLSGLTDVSIGDLGIRERLSGLTDVSLGDGLDTSVFGDLRTRFESLIPSASGATDVLGRVRDRLGGAVDNAKGFLGSLTDLIPSISEVGDKLPALASGSDEVAGALPAASESIKDTANNLPVLAESSDDAASSLPVLADAASENESIFSRFKRTLAGFIPSMDSVKDAFKTATGPLRSAGGAVRSSADDFASAVADVENYDDAMELVGNAASGVKDRLTSLGSGALDRVSNGFSRARTAIGQYTGSLIPANLGTKSLLGSMKKLALAPFKAIGAIITLAGTLISQGSSAVFAAIMNSSLATSLGSVAAMGIPVISSMAAVALTFIGVSGAAGVATGAVAALSLALDAIGIGLIIKAFVALIAVAGILAGVLSNIGGVSNAVGGAVDFLKGVLESVFNFLLAIGVPTWNLFIDILEAILAPVFAIKDAMDRLAQGLGLVGDEGTAMGGILSSIGTAFGMLGDAIGFVIGLFQGPFNVIADIIYAAFAIPLGIIVDIVLFLVSVLGTLFDAFMNLSIVQNTLSRIQQGVQLVQEAFEGMGSIIAGSVAFVESMIESMANMVIDSLNDIIENANSALPERFEIDTIDEFEMGDSGGAAGRLSSADASAQQARENAASMTEEDNENAQDDQAPAPNHETNNYEQNEYNFGDFNMNPEEKARVKGLVQDAINEANREQRFRDGGN